MKGPSDEDSETTVIRQHSLGPTADVSVAVDMEPGGGARPDLWPSVGEYPCYDDMIYQLMTMDSIRGSAYQAAISLACPGRRVLDIGTGRDLNWALAAARSGASQVTALEAMEESAQLAARTLACSPLREQIDLVRTSAADFKPETLAEVCVSEIIGCIGGAEGAAAVLADARRRLMAPGALFVPDSCLTMAGAVSIRDVIPRLGISVDSVPYLQKIFAAVGHPFDVRLTIANIEPEALVTTAAPVESLHFNGDLLVEDTEEASLRVTRRGRVDGILLWIQLRCAPRDAPIDTLHQPTSWVPVYLPAFDEPVPVRAGDRVQVRLSRALSDDGVHPDYKLDVRISTEDRDLRGGCSSSHHGYEFRSSPIYQELFTPA